MNFYSEMVAKIAFKDALSYNFCSKNENLADIKNSREMRIKGSIG